MSAVTEPVVGRLTLDSLPNALHRGWQMFLQTRPVSVSYAMIFALIGLIILVGIERASYAPLIFPLAGGFLLIGPILLSGYFALAERVERGENCKLADVFRGFSKVSRDMLSLAFACTLLFMIWVTDTATLYGFIVGRTPAPLLTLLSPAENVVSFLLWSSLLGAVLALIIFAISAFSVPLLYYRRARLVGAIYLSVTAVLANPLLCLLWAVILSATIIVSILILPLFLVTFPVLTFAGHALYRELFPG